MENKIHCIEYAPFLIKHYFERYGIAIDDEKAEEIIAKIQQVGRVYEVLIEYRESLKSE